MPRRGLDSFGAAFLLKEPTLVAVLLRFMFWHAALLSPLLAFSALSKMSYASGRLRGRSIAIFGGIIGVEDNSLSRVINARFSPGRIFKMSETEIALRLADLAGQQRKIFFVTDSAHLRQIGRSWSLDRIAALRAAHVSPTFL
jgi:hypothetical protein